MTKLQTGDMAPGFELLDGEGNPWSLDDLKGKKVILYFYPADDTPGCTVEACDFRDTQTQWGQSGYVVLGVSPQGPDSHRRFSEKYELNFPLLVDADRSVAQAYGAADDSGGMFKGKALRVKRATFVIDEEGRITEALYGVRGKGHVDQLREILGV